MKIIVCGPPHSGKSVFVNNLMSLLPTETLQLIQANGDGEGMWTNNPNQEETDTARLEYKKRKDRNTIEAFETWKERIKNAKANIVLVDIGGIIDNPKRLLFEASDSFIVISNNTEDKQRWIDFGEENGCKCIAAIDSSLTEPDDIYSNDNCVLGRLKGLERGNASLIDSKVIRAIAEHILLSVDYKATEVINVYSIAIEMGMSTSWRTSYGMDIHHVGIGYNVSRAQEIYNYFKEKYDGTKRYLILGANRNWLASVISNCLCSDNVKDIMFYDEWTGKYIHPCILVKKQNAENKDITIEVEEKGEYTIVKFILEAQEIDNDNFKNYQLPVIDETKKLCVSGKFPNWFTVSVLKSYSNKEKYIHVPGLTTEKQHNYVCVETEEPSVLGRIVDPYNED